MIVHNKIQHGVGQGSFHSASVEVHQPGQRYRFDYVYDCGAGMNHPTAALGRCIKRLGLERRQSESSTKGYLDILVLSHYDQDHINGAQQLANHFNIGRVVLPYIGLEELALLIASQAVTETETIRALYRVAHRGGMLWGVPVTMVKAGQRDSNRSEELDVIELNGESAIDFDTPHKVSIVVNKTRKAPEAIHEDGVNLHIESVGGLGCWKLRFWNRGIDQNAGLVAAVRKELDGINFPFPMVEDKSKIDEFIDWVENHKTEAHDAYKRAIKCCFPGWRLSKKKLPNFISLAMYSGPSSRLIGKKTKYRFINSGSDLIVRHWWQHAVCWQQRCVGWLGTGDATLGESGAWEDFRCHYKQELQSTSTVLIPHHGAAPASGPKFFNPDLIHKPDVMAVISFGANNTYGHPTTSVLEQIMLKGGGLQLVTENTVPGFCEQFVFN